jgi:ATP-dependent helicase/nuclease subunit A
LANEAPESAKERAEGIRVAYVAATRAQDLLVVPAVGDEMFPAEGWTSPLSKALYPSQHNWRKSRAAPGCPEFKGTSVLERPRDYDTAPEASVRPGLIEPHAGSHEVVWWDPRALHLDQEGDEVQDVLLRRILHEDEGQSLAAYRAWQEARAAAIQVAAAPRYDVFVASQSKEPPPGEPAQVEYIAASHRDSRPGGRRFGTLVHYVLRDVELTASHDDVGALVELAARVLGAPAEEREAALEAVGAAIANPVFDRARTATRCHREYPVTLQLEGSRLLEGILDLAFVEAGVWIVVDFKTDADIAESRVRYERQLQWYVYALKQITGMPGRGVLLGV